jgi:hypothetical protein
MNARWTLSVTAFAAALLGGALLASAAAPNLGQDRSPMQDPAGTIRLSTLTGTTVLDLQGQKLGRIKDIALDAKTGQPTFVVLDTAAPASGQATTYTAARPIDNSGMPAPSLPPSAVAAPSPPPCVVSPYVNSANPGWTQDLEDFYNE